MAAIKRYADIVDPTASRGEAAGKQEKTAPPSRLMEMMAMSNFTVRPSVHA
jgi:hypothetical protein